MSHSNSNSNLAFRRSKVEAALPSEHVEDEPQSPLQYMAKWVRENISHRNDGSLKDAIREVLDEHSEEGMATSEEERNLLRNMLHFGELTVSGVMVPRNDIVAVSVDSDLQSLKGLIVENKHSRYPVYDESLDTIVGFIHMKDLAPFMGEEKQAFNVQELKRNILFVAPSMRIIDLLMQMRLSHCHIAIVVDEYGGTDGLITMEDVLEELVGDISEAEDEDEHFDLKWTDENTLEADARVMVEQISIEIGVDVMPKGSDDYDTLGGLIFNELGRVPARGEVMFYEGIKMDVIAADPRRVLRVRLHKPEALRTKDAENK